ncbi:hypothetical protein HO173_005839 [Letharia columbiana]|uniref:Uncharacterized protein n=1 Tax=Letharia columbiana TaxID=112416 RepID=A0A8H6L5C2_9LECA|nr:uncharacterized protein HO173_005839 [Letharia columbiana]KAF6236209.1 hypothetical protein HO173_005839 [Letharia columbiana]
MTRPSFNEIPKVHPYPTSRIPPAVKDPQMRIRAKKLVGDVVRAEDSETPLRKASKPKSGIDIMRVHAGRGPQQIRETRIRGDR